MAQRGLLFILSAPAGTGKTTLVQRLVNEFPHVIASISCTTRFQRPYEVSGVDYFFLTEEEFVQRIKNGEFLEYVKLYDHYYGTLRTWVEEQLNLGKHVFLVIDTQGALQLKGKLDAVYIFVSPPSLEELERRLKGRQTESQEALNKRLGWAKEELLAFKHYDYLIVNDNLEKAYQALRSIVVAEEHKVR